MKMSQMRELFFSLSMAFAMSFCMEYYNLSLNAGGASYPLFINGILRSNLPVRSLTKKVDFR